MYESETVYVVFGESVGSGMATYPFMYCGGGVENGVGSGDDDRRGTRFDEHADVSWNIRRCIRRVIHPRRKWCRSC
jgi:hypothetical protein